MLKIDTDATLKGFRERIAEAIGRGAPEGADADGIRAAQILNNPAAIDCLANGSLWCAQLPDQGELTIGAAVFAASMLASGVVMNVITNYAAGGRSVEDCNLLLHAIVEGFHQDLHRMCGGGHSGELLVVTKDVGDA